MTHSELLAMNTTMALVGFGVFALMLVFVALGMQRITRRELDATRIRTVRETH